MQLASRKDNWQGGRGGGGGGRGGGGGGGGRGGGRGRGGGPSRDDRHDDSSYDDRSKWERKVNSYIQQWIEISTTVFKEGTTKLEHNPPRHVCKRIVNYPDLI